MNRPIKTLALISLILLLSSCAVNRPATSPIDSIIKPKAIEDKFLAPDRTNAQTVKGLREGVWTWLDKDGKVYLKAAYAKGQAHGCWNYYHPNGNLKRQEYYQNGKAAGTWKYFSEQGVLQMEMIHYRLQAMREHLFYYPSGRIAYRQKYVKTDIYRLDGYSAEYYPNGRLRFETHFEEGQIAGFQRWYYPNGQLMMEGFQKNGLHLGLWTKYAPNGEIIAQTVAPDAHWVYQHIPLE
jgi:antitoxin component YwqK of YwqJK toxin-antitoxin module